MQAAGQEARETNWPEGESPSRNHRNVDALNKAGEKTKTRKNHFAVRAAEEYCGF